MLKYFFFFIIFAIISNSTVSQTVKVLHNDTTLSLRGLSVADDLTIWASGTKGTVLKSLNAGESWQRFVVKGYENTDFRDIEAFDENNAIIMGVGSPAYVLKTIDGGNTWRKVYENDDLEIFLDAMEFINPKQGIILGDPIQNKFVLLCTKDSGKSWKPVNRKNIAVAGQGEACFASSGTNIRKWKKNRTVYITGGTSAHIIKGTRKIKLPLQQGAASKGANSIAVNGNLFIVVGGDYTKANDTLGNCAISTDAGKTWAKPAKSPSGYRSCVEFLEKGKWITCGINGVDLSTTNGNTWQTISQTGFHVVRKARSGKKVYLAGSSGRIAVLEL